MLLSKGYGFANAERQIPNSPSTKFRLGSITKQFTAAAILILEDCGKLKTSGRVRKYLPDAPAAWDESQLEVAVRGPNALGSASTMRRLSGIGGCVTCSASLLYTNLTPGVGQL